MQRHGRDLSRDISKMEGLRASVLSAITNPASIMMEKHPEREDHGRSREIVAEVRGRKHPNQGSHRTPEKQ
jgi:hypothetical protein